MKYFKYTWNESRGDDFDSWGKATYLFEVAPSSDVCKQVELYENGYVLKYDHTHINDVYGSFASSPFDPTGCEETDFASFYTIWNDTKAINLPDLS